jgi:Zinc carboxypeptidase
MMEQNKSERRMGIWLVGFGVVVFLIVVGIFIFKRPTDVTVVGSSESKVGDSSVKPQAAVKAAVAPWQRDNARGKLVQQKPAPSLEHQRVTEEGSLSAGDLDAVKIAHDFEGCGPEKITRISPTHFEIEMPDNGLRNWFLFRVDGAAGKIVRFDIVKPVMTHWWSLNPVYSEMKSLDEQDLISAAPTTGPAVKEVAYNTPELPDTRGQKWKFVSDVWVDGEKAGQKLCFDQRFEKDGVYVAFRYPCLPKYEEGFLAEVGKNPAAKVNVVGETYKGRPLNVVVVGDGEPRKPCVVIAARDHANDQDAGWAANGAIKFLISNEPEAQYIRGKFNFLVIPMIDPDAAANGTNFGIGDQFMDMGLNVYRTGHIKGSDAYAQFFEDWTAKGGRIDIVLALYGVESAESPHVACPEIDKDPYRREHDLNLYDQLMQLCADRYVINPKPWASGVWEGRVESWLEDNFGSISIAYMPNSQDAQRHLSLAELEDIGRAMALSTTLYLDSEDGEKLMAEVDVVRAAREDRKAQLGSQLNGVSARRTEAMINGRWEAAMRNMAARGVTTMPAVPRRPTTGPR